MIKLENKSNVNAPNATFPYGSIKDDTGVGDGTPVDVQVYGDFHQFFARLFNSSGLVANGLIDSEANGFQLYEALLKVETNLALINQSSINKILARLDGGDFNQF